MRFSNLLSTALDAMNNTIHHNRYTLKINNNDSTDISVFSLDVDEKLNQPWRYTITFTSANGSFSVNNMINQPASFSFKPDSLNSLIETTSALNFLSQSRTLYGVITHFNQLSFSKDETHYQIVLQPRLALLNYSRGSGIYQNQSVVSVVESVLRKHGLTGIDYRLVLKNDYPKRELITQWQESDLAFILRLLADVGIWIRFETHPEHHCDVVVISDESQGFDNRGSIINNDPNGMEDKNLHSIWALKQHSQTVHQSVTVNDYNYRKADKDLIWQTNTDLTNATTLGNDYRYGEHYKKLSDSNENNEIESGKWYAKIRHQYVISHQRIIQGKCNDFDLAPGQILSIQNNQLSDDIRQGVIILTTRGYGDRSRAYQIEFTAIPFQILNPYRPKPLPFPTIHGTLPARVTSPDNDTYGYIDIHGRYRVKLNFDLVDWSNGEESLWIRLAKPYAGSTYGFHFPLIDGTEVAIAFTDGNPDRPYIAYAMHDSNHPDHVTTANKHRNVIRTPANNKLRMDDKRGKEHIKLATEYGKTQLNIGYLVNQNKAQRGEGFELRTDAWGAISANRGLYLTTQTEPNAQGKQLDMQGAITELENALSIAKALQNVAESAQGLIADTESQQKLQTNLTNLTQPSILAYASEGIALTSPENIQLSTANNLTMTSSNQTDISALKSINFSASEAISLLAQKSGMKIFANQEDIEIQAQTNNLLLAAKQDIQIDSTESKVDVSASKKIVFICGGSFIKISEEGIELGTSNNITIKSNAMQKMDAASLAHTSDLPGDIHCQGTQGQQVSEQQACITLE